MDANRHDHFWRLDPYEDDSLAQLRKLLAAKGCLPTENITKPKAIARLHRLEKKQICYDLCNDDELKKFAVERGMVVKSSSFTRRRMLNFLERADENFSIPFLELAPELRTFVYEYYLHDMPEYIDGPSQPPLARTCRLLRKEVLPMFYHECSFKFWIDKHNQYGDSSLFLGYLTTSFLETVAEKNFAKIRKFMFAVGYTVIRDGGITRNDDLAVSYNTKERIQKRGKKAYHWTQARYDSAGRSLQEFIEGLPEDADGKMLTKDDIEEVRKEMEKYYLLEPILL